jgi:hypothetical protein
MKQLFMKNYFFLMVLAFTPFLNSCKKCKQGVLEVKVTYNSGLNYEPSYYAIVVEDGLYDPETEFNYKIRNHDMEIHTGYYWPNESARSLGYTELVNNRDIDGSENYFRNKKGSNLPGENGHWNSGAGSSCLNGTWTNIACGDPNGVIWTFNSNGTGSFSNKDCNGICSPIVFTFSYSVTGNECNVSYDATQPFVQCTGYPDSRPPKPNDESFTFSCSGNQLTVSSGNGTTTFTK